MAMATDWVQVYRDSLYAFRDADAGWRRFALDAPCGEPTADLEAARRTLGLGDDLTLITAWNPDSEEQPEDWNRAANERLAADLRAAGVRFQDAYGASLPGTDPAWREDGFALRGVGREEAVAWGRRFGQRALVRVDADGCGLLFCAEDTLVPCAVRALADG
jgi:hypothetical protein